MNKFMIIIPIFFIILVVWFCNPTTQNGFLCVVFDFARFKFCCFSLYLANLNLLNMFPDVQNALYDLPESGRHKQK
jgi:hypothetical protein